MYVTQLLVINFVLGVILVSVGKFVFSYKINISKSFFCLFVKILDCLVEYDPFPKQQILDSSKQKEFADDNFKFDENARTFSKQVENTVGKGEIARVFKILELQTHKNQGLFGKGLTGKQFWKRRNCLLQHLHLLQNCFLTFPQKLYQ